MDDEEITLPFAPKEAERLTEDQQLREIIDRQAKKAILSMVQFHELEMMYTCAIKEVKTKFEVLSTELNCQYKRNPISYITTRLKSRDSIFNKLARRNLPLTVESIEQNLNDMAGIRVVCSYIDDIYKLAESFLAQDDITLLERKDYIENPKPNGYRSLHLIVSVPVFFSKEKRDMKVEVQIRTIAMDFWASLEHQMKYKKAIPDQDKIIAELKRCADVISNTDKDMLTLRKHIEAVQDEPTEEEILFEKLRQINKPI